MKHAFTLALLGLAACAGTGNTDLGGDIGRGAVVGTTHGGAFGGTNGGSGTITGNANVTSDSRFGFVPHDARVSLIGGRASVYVNNVATACASPAGMNLTLSFGDTGTALVAGTYLVDGGATIVWSEGSANGPDQAVAVSGLINCNSVTAEAIAGSFSAELPLSDGGISELTGIFTAVPCDP